MLPGKPEGGGWSFPALLYGRIEPSKRERRVMLGCMICREHGPSHRVIRRNTGNGSRKPELSWPVGVANVPAMARTRMTYSTIRVMLSSDLPTDVPPYFWTIHGTLSSAEFRMSDSSSETGESDLDAIQDDALLLCTAV